MLSHLYVESKGTQLLGREAGDGRWGSWVTEGTHLQLLCEESYGDTTYNVKTVRMPRAALHIWKFLQLFLLSGLPYIRFSALGWTHILTVHFRIWKYSGIFLWESENISSGFGLELLSPWAAFLPVWQCVLSFLPPHGSLGHTLCSADVRARAFWDPTQWVANGYSVATIAHFCVSTLSFLQVPVFF